MEEKILVVNCGSSSLKFKLFDLNEFVIASGIFERIGEDSCYTLKYNNQKIERQQKITNHKEAVLTMISELLNNGIINSIDEIKSVGHRILHGGEKYNDSVIITDEVLNDIKSMEALGKLHIAGEIAGILAMEKYIKVPQVAVFDTAFHSTIPEENYIYAVPQEWYKEYKIRKYGFHGISYKYITEKMKHLLSKDNLNLIICHIGSGASITAIKDSKSYDTTMGMTPLAGLVMGTRSGSIDPSIVNYLSEKTNKTSKEIDTILNLQSGLFGLCGKNDYRDVEKMMFNGEKEALLAFNIFKKSIEKYIAEYYFELKGNVDAIVFTAGVGENAIYLRKMIVEDLSSVLNIHINEDANNSIARVKKYSSGIITTKNSSIPIYVIPTDEELMILRDTYMLTKEKVKIK